MKFEVPAAVGVPLITPVLKLRPAGKLPVVTAYVYGLAPPLVLKVTLEYAVPTVPAVNAPATGEATNVGGLIVIVAVAGLEVPPAFVAVY